MTESLEGLRKFHNWIKSQLIFEAQRKTKGDCLLDIAVGRGGDIMKWNKAKLKYVTGFDIDSKSIYENDAHKEPQALSSVFFSPPTYRADAR